MPMDKSALLSLLRRNVVPALGCTEPVCVAVAAADAAKVLGGTVEHIAIEVSQNIFKNGVSVGIAGFDRVGLDYAAALGAMIARPELGLEVMKAITPDVSKRAKALVESTAVHVTVKDCRGIYVKCELQGPAGCATSTIEGGHTRIVQTTKNGQILHQLMPTETATSSSNAIDQLMAMKIASLRQIVMTMDEAELGFLSDGAVMNEALADFGREQKPGIGIADVMYRSNTQRLLGEGLMQCVMARVASATEARLEGCPKATMSSAGSGSKGIAVILPVMEVAKATGASRLATLQALAFAHLLNEYINAHVGKLSAVCACSMASATAAAASMTWLLGGGDDEIALAIRNMTGSITGVICDGGKVGCALKLSMAIGAAFLSTALAVEKVGLRVSDGICAETAEDNIRHMGAISQNGMQAVDGEILRIMKAK